MDLVLSNTDICEQPHCYDAAEVRVLAKSGGYLDFCAHHYDRHLKLPGGKEKMEAFALEVIDERDFHTPEEVEV